MPGILLPVAREWISYADLLNAAPTPINVGDQAVMVLGPVDVTAGSSDALDFAVTPAMHGHNFQPGEARISGLIIGPPGAAVTIKLLNGGVDFLGGGGGVQLVQPDSVVNMRRDLDLDLTAVPYIEEGTPLKLWVTAFNGGCSGLKGLTVCLSGQVVT